MQKARLEGQRDRGKNIKLKLGGFANLLGMCDWKKESQSKQ
jgi:hypothetical protein